MRKWIRSYAIGNRIFDLYKIGRDKYRISQGSGRRALHKGSLAECSDFIKQKKQEEENFKE